MPKREDVTGGFNGNEGSSGTTREQQEALARANDQMGWVPTRDLAKITSGDSMGVHYDGKSQITIGARYAYEAARLAGYDVGTVRSGNYDARPFLHGCLDERQIADGQRGRLGRSLLRQG